jgi:ubiquinol-cytochrome c reductase cytochrome b subunit
MTQIHGSPFPIFPKERMSESVWDKLNRYTRLNRLSYPVPEHGRHLPFVLGGLTFTGFLILVATGLVIAQVYNPSGPKAAYESVNYLRESGFGYLRSLHAWTAEATVLVLLLHLLRVFFTGAYKTPRQVTWWLGVALFAAMVYGSFFSGTVLKWDAEGADAAEHYQATLRGLGPIGSLLLSDNEGHTPLSVRIYFSHVTLFPLLIVLLIVGHFYLIRVFNLAPTPWGTHSALREIPPEQMRGKFYHHLLGILFYGAIYYGMVAIAAIIFPAELGAAPAGGHSDAKPPWPFLWLYGLENFFGVGAIFYGSLALFTLLILVPFLDVKRERRISGRRKTVWAGGAALLALFALGTYAWIAPPQPHMGHGQTHADEAEPHTHDEDPSDSKSDHHD